MTHVEFGPYENFKSAKEKSYTYRYPWDKITKSGKQYGFYVGVNKKPKPPATLKNRNWGIIPAQRGSERGWYIYVKNFTNRFNPEE